jgi:ubiquinone/menaquinone biosynthesis C-methylase UbiE
MDAEAWDQRYASSTSTGPTGPDSVVAAELADLAAGHAIDLASGSGRHAIWLAAQGWRVTAVDFSAVALGQAARVARRAGVEDSIHFVLEDVLTIEPRSVFDCALLSYLQVTQVSRRAAVRAAFRALRPGGTFMLIAHDSTNLLEGTGGPQDPDVLYAAEEVLRDLAGERFDVVRAERVSRVVDPTTRGHEHIGKPAGTAYDAVVHLVRRQ